MKVKHRFNGGKQKVIFTIYEAITYLLEGIGLFGVFKKSGRKGIYAFIPVVRQYQIAIASEHEEEGRVYCILYACGALPRMILAFMDSKESLLHDLLMLTALAFGIAAVCYGLRIMLALCRMYQRSRKWVIAWILLPSVTALIWGFNDKFQPVKQVHNVDYDKAAAISGANVEALKHGVTVNLTDRTATEFFRKKYLLKDIHLSIPTGHMVLLLGGSGAGKTTFLNAITGYEKANAEIILNGTDVYSNYESMKYDLGFVPQQDLMRMNDTVEKTLSDAAGIRLPKTMSHVKKRERIKEMLDKFGLSSVRHNLVGKLSGGQRKRLSIAMEFISDPTLFILDEPDSGLDGVVARKLFLSLRDIADEGKIVMVITHTPDRVIDLFDDVIVLAKDSARTGRLAYYGQVKDAYTFFGRDSMEEIVLSVNQKDEGGEGRAEEFVNKYSSILQGEAG